MTAIPFCRESETSMSYLCILDTALKLYCSLVIDSTGPLSLWHEIALQEDWSVRYGE